MTEKKLAPLQMEDLAPKEAIYETGGMKFTLSPFTLRVRVWVKDRFGSMSYVESALQKMQIEVIAEIVYFMIKDKQGLTLDQFLDKISTVQEMQGLLKAVVQSLGVSEAKFEEIQKSIEAEEAALEKKESAPSVEAPTIGASSST